jgi:hypothetical protein
MASETLTGLCRLAVQGPIYSNDPEAIYLFTGHAARLSLLKYNPYSLQTNPRIEPELQRMGKNIPEDQGILVIFRTVSWRPYLPAEAEILKQLSLASRLAGRDGTIYLPVK